MGEVLLGKGEILKKLNAPEMYFWHLGSVVMGHRCYVLELFFLLCGCLLLIECSLSVVDSLVYFHIQL